MENQKRWPVEVYAKLHKNSWIETTFGKGQCCLFIKAAQLYVINKETAFESVCLLGGNEKVKCFYANQSLGITEINNQQKIISKFRIRFASTFGKAGEDCCVEAAEELRKFISVTEHPSHKGRKPKANFELKQLSQVVKEILDGDKTITKNFVLNLPEEVLNETIQQCLLDPEFPICVSRIEELIEKHNEEIS